MIWVDWQNKIANLHKLAIAFLLLISWHTLVIFRFQNLLVPIYFNSELNWDSSLQRTTYSKHKVVARPCNEILHQVIANTSRDWLEFLGGFLCKVTFLLSYSFTTRWQKGFASKQGCSHKNASFKKSNFKTRRSTRYQITKTDIGNPYK